MQRVSVLLLTAALGGCATQAQPGGPVPTERPAATASAEPASSHQDTAADRGDVGRRQDSPRRRTGSDSLIDAEIAAELESAADSVADADALEELADSHPAGSADSGAADSADAVTWDIDVATFSGHDRVRYYLDFFTGVGRERMQVWLQRLPRYEPMIRTRLAEAGLPGDLVYLALIESGFSNRAVSRSRAVGMWQFMAPTGRGYGLRIDGWVDERRDPVKATAAATRFLKDLRARFGSLYLAAAAYNGGAGRVGRGLNALGDGEPVEEYSDSSFFRLYDSRLIHRETKDYVPKLIAAATIAKEPSRYGFVTAGADQPFAADSVYVADMTGLDVIARLADTTVAVIRDLNPQYLRLVTPPDTRAIVLVPPGMGERTQLAFNDLPARERVTFREHVVTRGQTASGIARKYEVSLTALYEANPRIRSRSLQIGQRLVIPVGGAMSTVVARSVSEPATRTVSFHRVRRGETVSGIARRYGVSQAKIREWNRLSASGRINAGQRLRIGASATERARVATRSSARTHTVRRGDTLSGVAQRYGVSLSALASANGLSAKSGIRVGQRLKVPMR
jgi:membrane-bound lytic murein transglycosylase D